MKKSLLALTLIFAMVVAHSQSLNNSLPPAEKSRIIKTDFFAPLTGNLSFGYEQTLVNSITLNASLGIIGVGVIQDNLRPAGIFIKAGTKLYFSPDYTLDGMKRFNDFQGGYFNPEIIYSGFGFDYDRMGSSGYTYTDRGTNHSFALMLNLGKQWVFAKTISLDIYAGVGYGGSIVNAPDAANYGSYSYNESELVPQKYSHLQPDNQIPIAFDAGLNLGILLK